MEISASGRQERYRGDFVSLAQRVHSGLRRVLLLPAGHGRLAHILKRRAGTEVHGLETDAECLRTAKILLDSVVERGWAGGPLPFTEGYFDAAVIRDFGENLEAFQRGMGALAPVLSGHGFVYVLMTRNVPETRIDAVDGWTFFGSWRSGEGTTESGDVLQVFVRTGYSLEAHVGELLALGHHEAAYELLSNLPPEPEDSPDAKAAVQSLCLRVLVEWIRKHPEDDPVPFFCRGMHHFRDAVIAQRYHRPAYEAMASMWTVMGEEVRGTGLLRSLDYLQTGISAPSLSRAQSPSVPGPTVWTQADGKPRILFVLPPQPHYGLDVVYDGLCRQLGVERVTDFPWKPTLHGEKPVEFANYPCMFDWPSAPLSLEAVLAQLRAGGFDLVLYGDCELALDSSLTRALAGALGSTPLFLFDASDELMNRRRVVEEALGGVSAAAYFKREMLCGVDYGPQAYPMPFAYPEERALPDFASVRDQEVFWAGHRGAYLRPLYLEVLERHMGQSFDGLFPPEAYANRLRRSRIGLNLFGYGFDTVRYWELPAHGCLLLSERPPIRIPNNFVDGEHALFFEDAQELQEKLAHYRAHPEATERLARAGHAHFWTYHTASARALDLLGWIRQARAGL